MPAATNKVVRIARPPKVSLGERIAKLADGLTSLVTGMGGDKDKLASAFHQFTALTAPELETAYRTSWIARKLIDIPAYDVTREWRSWQGDDEQITAIEDYEQRLQIQRKTMQAMIKGRLYGGGALILGVNQGRNEDELDIEAIKKDDLQFVHAVSRWDIAAGPMVRDIASPYFGEAEYYERRIDGTEQLQRSPDITGKATLPGPLERNSLQAGVRFHPSRVIRFVGAERPDNITANEVWGDPVLQVVMDAVKAAELVTNSTAQLVAESKVDVIKIPGLTENITNTVYEDRLNKRFSVANMVKGVYSMLLIDKEEEWERHNVTFSGLQDILNMYFLVASGAADIPATRFLGQSPAGMNATGESDLRNHYDSCASKQKNEVTPALARLDNVLIPSALGTAPEELFYLWNPLWQMSEKEKSERDKSQAETFKIDVDAGMLDTIVLKKARENQLIESGPYPGFEQILADFDGKGDSAENPPAEPGGLIDPETGLPPDPNDPEAVARSKADPNANPDVDPDNEEGGGVDKATKAKKKKSPFGDSARRIRPGTFKSLQRNMRFSDATPRTLYVYRPLLNVKDVAAWAKAQGFDSILNDLHTTIIYSKERVDWVKAYSEPWGQEENGNLIVRKGGPRVMEQFGAAQVLVFGNENLTWRNMQFRDRGCSYDYEDFNPHVTITYRGEPDRLRLVEPYQGELVFGPEVWEEINPKGFDETDPKVERMLDGVAPEKVVLPQGIAPEQLDALVSAIIDRIPKPSKIVDDATFDPHARYKEVTVVTKHDDKGRVLEFERRKVIDEEQG